MVGKVILVGAGPGNAGLLTLRGKAVLESADAVLYDRLAGPEILAMIPDGAAKIDVGKSAGRHPIPQSEINAMLLRFAKEGKTVVRLKGGDPYLFGRGAEELEAVQKENIPFEVVPGVTSALAAPAFAGIPASHREYSSSVHIVTAHRKGGDESEIDYESLVKLKGTLIFLMGLENIGSITAGLIQAGMPVWEPAALIENGTRAYQRKLVSCVGQIAEKAKQEQFKPPAILVVGGVCSLADRLDWFSALPLYGVSAVVTAPGARGGLARKLRELGANVIDFPCIKTEPLAVPDKYFSDFSQYAWIVFTSPAGAELFFKSIKARGLDVRTLFGVKFAAVGAKTAAVVTDRSMAVDYTPVEFNARALAEGLPGGGKEPLRVLIFRAEDGAPGLAETLRSRGFEVDDVAAYRTVYEDIHDGKTGDMLESGAIDYVTFSSASAVKGFTSALPGADYSKTTSVCIGDETAAEALKHGFNAIVSDSATIESMVEIILKRPVK